MMVVYHMLIICFSIMACASYSLWYLNIEVKSVNSSDGQQSIKKNKEHIF